jgi:acetaldehyde/propanal dehydrogenase
MTAAAARTAEMFAEEILAGTLTLSPTKATFQAAAEAATV